MHRFTQVYTGHIPGHCDGTNLNIGGSYLVYLDPHSLGNTHYFTMKYPEDSGEKQYLDDAVYMCGATSKLPKGVTKETAKFVCPSPNAEPTECIPPPTTATPPEPPTPKVKVGPPPAEADHKPGTSTSGNGASYESVVEDNSNNKNNNNNKDDGDKDAATSLLGSWLLSLSLIFCRLL
ncbi:hypothetical protein RRG08_019512 [Elysia crispata]|uniref:Uncharacterized protein n=1 Tax=Elysia crispata TaxID=231223 RepID=A0AAE0Z4T4_9GAST|nr:hypothetical protein RRG08_019512 [Elysia crispata]